MYLTVDELKGKRPVIRGSTTLVVRPDDLRNLASLGHLPARSSGSRGPATTADVDFDFVRDLSVNHCLAIGARSGGAPWQHAIWNVPGNTALKRILWLAGFGAVPVRWFSPVDHAAPHLHARYRWSMRAMHWGSRVAGVPVPAAVYVPPSEPSPIVQWMASVLAAGGTPHLATYPSGAVRLAEAARTANVGLTGAQLTISGEPITPARLAAVRRTGATVVPQYGASEAGGTIGHGCLAPSASDDLHVFHDVRAVIHPERSAIGSGLAPTTLLFSTLRPTAPLVLLNVSLGDRAVIEDRRCGCPLGDLGWYTHLHSIRSDEKLTVGGMNLLDLDLMTVLDELLPSRFGGGVTDYQLVEDEHADGRPHLRLIVNPSVGPLDERAVVEAFLEGIGRGSGVQRIASHLWRDSNVVEVERQFPEAGASGKILHLHFRHSSDRVSAARA